MSSRAFVDRTARLDVLARRVRWLERYRRLVALGCALALAPIIMFRLSGVLGTDWPGVHATALSAIATAAAWWIIEVALAWTTAVYETEHDRLLGEKSLPRAQLLRR